MLGSTKFLIWTNFLFDDHDSGTLYMLEYAMDLTQSSDHTILLVLKK
jgi:hypothetical protein